MSLLRMMEGKLPPGFRFHPRDDELVCDYLAKKTNISSGDGSSVITFFGFPPILLDDVDLNKCEPWDLPEMSCVGGKEWYFFNLRDRKYATGQRTNRATATGYWKATGKDRHITRKGMLVGMRKTLVFYQGRAPKGKKTDWVMHEFRMENKPAGDDSKYIVKEDWVLCRIFYKSRGMPSKPSMETSAYEDTCSSSLPPPPKETYITFGLQTPMSLEGYEQVPCFSNNAFPVSTPSAMAVPYDAPLVVESSMQKREPQLPEFGVDQLDCDKKVITAVLNHLTKFDGNMQKREPLTSLGEGNFNTYYLCENGLSSVW